MRCPKINNTDGKRSEKLLVLFLSKFKIALHPILDDLAESSVQDALRYGISVYDSCYLAQSKTFDKELYTADEKMLAKGTGKERVVHLKEY